MRPVERGIPWRTSGIQKCRGASPSFINRAMERALAGRSVRELMAHSPVYQALMRLENRSRAEAAAWVRKYFVAASMARGWGVLVIRGIIASVLISRPIQARSQW